MLYVVCCMLYVVSCAQGRNFISLWEGPSPSDVGLSTPMMARVPPNVGKKWVKYEEK